VGFFNNLGNKLGKTAQTVTKKSEDLVEIAKLNITIGNEEDKIKKLLLEMGSELYAKFDNGECFGESLNEKCTQVKAIYNSIASLKEKVNSVKGHNVESECCKDIKDEPINSGEVSEENPEEHIEKDIGVQCCCTDCDKKTEDQ